MTSNHLIFRTFSFLLVVQVLVMEAKSETQIFSKTLYSLQGARKGQIVKELKQVKQYLKVLGYFPNENRCSDLSDYYDDVFESAVKIYQKYYRLQVTGKLDSNTINQMIVPRCGVADIFKSKKERRWSKRELTYSFNSSVEVMSIEQVSPIVAKAFQQWANQSGLTIREVLNSSVQTDMVLGFHRGRHECRNYFDGPQGILGHAFYPENGMCHFDADEYWSTSDEPFQPGSIDFDSVAIHEMGHLLGLEHSQDVDAVMYAHYEHPNRDLAQNDIDRIRALYNLSS